MDWLSFAAIVIAAGVAVFAIIKDRQNNEVVRYLYELIDSLLDEAKVEDE